MRTGHAAVVEAQLSMVAQAVAHDGYVTHDVEAGSVAIRQDHARPRVRRRVGIGHGHDDEKLRAAGIGGEPFVPVDDPLVAVEHCGGAEHDGVRPGVLRLGHGEGGIDIARHRGLQIALLLLRRTGHPQDFLVTAVRRVGAERAWRNGTAAELLVHEAEGDEAHPQPTGRARQMRCPEVRCLHICLQLAHPLLRKAGPLRELSLVGIDVLAHDLFCLGENRPLFRRRAEIEPLGYLPAGPCACANSTKNPNDSGLATTPAPTACSSGTPINSFFTGTSSFLPLSVRGIAGTATISSGTWRGDTTVAICARIAARNASVSA